VPVRGPDEAAVMATAFNDMTAAMTRWHAEAHQRERELQQSQKMEAVGQLAGGVSHDFNNLLTAIHGYAELLLLDLPVGDELARGNVAQIIKGCESAGALTRQLLIFSRKQVLAPQIVNLGDIIKGMEKMLCRLIGEDIDLVVNRPQDLWSVRADPGQIEQVIMNLAVNARDAMPDGGRLSIDFENAQVDRVEADAAGNLQPGPFVRVTVSDTGVGMDTETRARAFEPFFTTKELGRGTGLGLAMVYGIVEQSGGAIAVDSEPTWGAVFRILLPRVASETPGETAAPIETAPAGGSETVLLAEDDPTVRQFVCDVLRREGYHAIEASRGNEALALAARFTGPIDLLLTDVVMPGMSGRVLWEKLLATRPEARVIFMSGYTDDAVVRHGIRDTGLPYLQKPFTYAALAREIRRVLALEGRPGRAERGLTPATGQTPQA
jgi:signal transduction histidine kinase/CheY-like chemotaxis protein